MPVHVSATSQTPVDERHTNVFGWSWSVGQAVDEPSQVSAMSQTPAEVRQTVLAGVTASAGQAVLEPSHDSAWSQRSTDDRQTVPDALTASAGQMPEPLHVSARSHGPAAARHTLAVPTNASAGHVADEPVQVSAASH